MLADRHQTRWQVERRSGHAFRSDCGSDFLARREPINLRWSQCGLSQWSV